MTGPQLISFAVIGLVMAAFIAGRVRYDLVAVGGLLVGMAAGVVPYEEAFSGFSSEIVIIVGSALVVSAAVARSGILDTVLARVAPGIVHPRAQLIVLVATTTVLSAFVKNIGALAILMPIAFQMARKSGVSASMFLMPMAFGSLLGGLMTQIGTSPNIIVSEVRGELTGTPFTMFDFTPVGVVLAAMGVVFLAVFYWLLPERKKEEVGLDEAIQITNYTTEARVTEKSASVGKTVSELQKHGGGRAMVTAIVLAGGRRRVPLPDAKLRAGDHVLLEGEEAALEKIVSGGELELAHVGGRKVDKDETGAVEAVVGPTSDLIGWSVRDLTLFDRSGLSVLAISRRGKRFTERMSEIRFEAGDVIVLQGSLKQLPELLRRWDCLPLAERDVRLGFSRQGILPLAILAVAVASTSLGYVPVGVAFFSAAVLIVLSGALPLREIYESIDGPVLVMLAALIPVSDSLRATGGTDLIAQYLSTVASGLPAWGAVAMIMVAAMAVTPFLNNAATVLVMAPIAAVFATSLGYAPEAFLMAVAIGAGCDFLTPIGHQSNTLVMGPGGYRFGDYARLGAPLSLLVILVATPMLMIVWPV